MINVEGQLHIRLPIDIYRKLKIECASELISMQQYVSNLITTSLSQSLPKEQLEERHEANEPYVQKLLLQLPLFYDVNQNDLVKLAQAVVVLHFRKGEPIIREGDLPNFYYIVEKGTVRVSKLSQSGKEITITIRHQSEPFGQPSVMLGEPHIASSTALEDTDVLAIRRESFLSFIARNTIVGARIINIEMERTCNLYEKMIDKISDSAPQRVIKTLHMLTAYYGTTLYFTHQDIAMLSWTTIETTTRVITQLKNLDILVSTRGNIMIKNHEKLLTYRIDTGA